MAAYAKPRYVIVSINQETGELDIPGGWRLLQFVEVMDSVCEKAFVVIRPKRPGEI